MEVFLYNSTVCRLCGEENDNGSLLYSCEDNNQTLCEIINTYLPIKVSDDGQLPRTICPGCTIQLEATVEFLNLIIKGQKILRDLHTREKEYKKNIFTKTEEPEIITENIVYEINTNNGVYQVEHPIALQVGGLEKPKRKRGRPPKKPKSPEELAQEAAAKEQEVVASKAETEEPSGKRRRKTPTRFKEAVQGKELDRIFKEEGVTDGEESDNDAKPDMEPNTKVPVSKEPEVIGHMEDSGELVVVVKGKGRGRPKGRMKQTREECAICGMEFSCVGRYMSHVAQHGPVMYQCPPCNQTFSTRLTFTEHQQATGHEGRNVIPCRQPKTKVEELKTEEPKQEALSPAPATPELASVDNMISNVMVPKSLPILDPQPANPEVPETIDNMECIEVVSSPMDPLKIEEVSMENTIPESVKEEETKVNPDQPKPRLKCNHCEKTFGSKQSKSLHIKAAHLGERPYSCLECGARFGYPRSLALHAVSHRRHRGNGKGYACDLCGKVLNHPSSVVYHKEAEHAGQRYVCNKCGKSFKHKQLLQRHQLVHSQLRPYVCKTCNASFKTKANLINHQLLHSGVKKFSCEICKHKFAHKTSLTLHMRWHTGQKPFSCAICGKSFSQKGNLSEHERIHTGEKPYHCSLCPRRFTTSSQHRLHARRHQAEHAYACEHCPKRFASRASWLAHQRREAASLAGAGAGVGAGVGVGVGVGVTAGAGPRPLRCGACGRAFADRAALAKHARRHGKLGDANKDKLKKPQKQMSLLVEQQRAGSPRPEQVAEPAEQVVEEAADLDERVIYVTYDVDDASQPAFHILDPEQAESMDESKVVTTCELYPSLLVPALAHEPALTTLETDHMPVTDEAGNPLHFTMADGTRLAITSSDGRSLQVLTQDGQTIPVEINGFADEEEVENEETIVHRLNLQKTVSERGSSPVTHYFTIV